MFRLLSATLLLALIAPTAFAQDGATRRATKAIRAQEKELLNRVTQRIEWDKQLTGSTLQVEVQPGGAVLLKGSVMNEAAKARAVDLVENTTGVATVTDELAVVKSIKVHEARPAASVVESGQPVVLPAESRLIVKP